MSITEASFDNEAELETWVLDNLGQFLPGSIYLAPQNIVTLSGKQGRPDGFAFNLQERTWSLIEVELLKHGVWPHIAEQITRFVVALRNSDTLISLRTALFEKILNDGLLATACESLDTTPERLLQRLELMLQGDNPSVTIFIDETNEDLHEMAQALSLPIQIFRVKKIIVNGVKEFYSPDQNVPAIQTDQSDDSSFINDIDVIDHLGGGELEETKGKVRVYKLADHSLVYIKKSKFHDRHNYYWYGVSPRVLAVCEEKGVSHFVFVMGQEGFVKVPVEQVLSFIETTRFSRTPDGAPAHYHVLISPGPEPEMFYSQGTATVALKDFYYAF